MSPHTNENPWLWRLGALALIVLASVLHVLYLTHDCPLDLAPDEAHYWDWSRHLDWSYYSKGPLVALMIRASCELFGPWAEATTGSLMPAIRFPAILSGALLLASLYVLTVLTLKRESLAFGVVACALTQPLIAAGSSLMTIDAPYTACWGWAVCVRASTRSTADAGPGQRRALLSPSESWRSTRWYCSSRRWRCSSFSRFVGLGSRIFTGAVSADDCHRRDRRCANPDLERRSTAGSRFTMSAGRQAPAMVGAGWARFSFLGGQFRNSARLLVRGLLPRCGDSAAWVDSDPDRRFLWWMSGPTIAVFLLLSLRTTGQLNWAVTAYLSGGILSAAWLTRGQRCARVAHRHAVATATAGSALIVAVHYPSLPRPLLLSIVGTPTVQHPLPLRRIDPTVRAAAVIAHWQRRSINCGPRCGNRVRNRSSPPRSGMFPGLAGGLWRGTSDCLHVRHRDVRPPQPTGFLAAEPPLGPGAVSRQDVRHRRRLHAAVDQRL